MHDEVREITGFACRWCLLALAGAAMLASSWMGLRGAGPVAGGLRAAVVSADVLCRQSLRKKAHLRFYHVDLPAWPGATHVLVSLPDGTQLTDRRLREGLSGVVIPRARAGQIELQVVGLPYGPVAFWQGRSVLVTAAPDVRPGRHESLVDGRVALSVPGPHTATWRRCMELMARRGQVAFFFVGSVEDYPAARAKLRHMHRNVPVEYAGPDDSAAYRRLRAIAGALNPGKAQDQPRPNLITGRRRLARQTGRRGFPTHLVGRADRPISGDEGVLWHASILQFHDWLRAEASKAEGGRP